MEVEKRKAEEPSYPKKRKKKKKNDGAMHFPASGPSASRSSTPTPREQSFRCRRGCGLGWGARKRFQKRKSERRMHRANH